jgi:hypothetical protein
MDDRLAAVRERVASARGVITRPEYVDGDTSFLLDLIDQQRQRIADLLDAANVVVGGMYTNDDEWFSLSETTKNRMVALEKALAAVDRA